MGIFDSSTQTTTSQAPWVGAQPYLKQVMGGAQQAYQNQRGMTRTPPLADYYTPYSAQTQQALSGMWNQAAQGNPLAGQSMNALAGYMPGGAMANQYQQMYGQAGTNASDLMNRYQQMYGQIGQQAGGLANQYQQMFNQTSNPYFEQALQNQVDLTANDIQRQFGAMGRTGSAADTGALATQLGQMRTNALSQNWNQNIQNQMAALAGAGGAEQWGATGQLGALSGYGGAQQQGLANQLGITQGLTQAQLNAVQAAPGAYQASMLPYQYQAQVGAAQDAQNKAYAQAQLQQWQDKRNYPWQQLSNYSQLVGGGALNTARSTQVPSSPLGNILGGAASGAAMLGPYGLGIPGMLLGGGMQALQYL